MQTSGESGHTEMTHKISICHRHVRQIVQNVAFPASFQHITYKLVNMWFKVTFVRRSASALQMGCEESEQRFPHSTETFKAAELSHLLTFEPQERDSREFVVV